MSAAELLNAMAAPEREAALLRCCGATRWARELAARAPFASDDALHAAAAALWAEMNEKDHLEAFAAHPQIGVDAAALRAKFATTHAWSGAEQARVADAGEETLARLAAQNRAYLERHGFIFIVCATGKSAAEMLALLEARLPNDRATEIANAAAEQAKITRLRLEKLT